MAQRSNETRMVIADQIVHDMHYFLANSRWPARIFRCSEVRTPTIVKLGNIAIRMFADDHNPPHFHIVIPQFQAIIGLSAMAMLAGEMDRHSLDIALEWARENRSLLEDEWSRLNER